MATTQQSKLIVYLIMVLGLVLGFLYSSASDPTAAVPAMSAGLQLSSLQALQGARIDTAFEKDPSLSALRIFGSLPVTPERGGTTDPFQ